MPDKIAAGLVSRTYFNVPLWAAQEHGFFAKEGLQVEGTIYGNASQVAPLLDGTFQVYIGSPELPIQNQAEGGPLKIVAGNAGKLVHSLITRAPFKRIEDLRGRMIGIFSDKEGTFFHVKAMLEAHGLSYPGDYQVKHTGGVPPRHKALLAGEIDAGLQSVPWNYVAEEVGMNNLGDVIEYVPDWQFVSVNINSQWAEKNRDVLVRFLRAILRATEWLYANRAAASAIAARELPAPIHHAERAWDFFTGTDALTRDVSVNLKGLAQVIATLKETNLLAKSASDDPKAYVDESYLKAARAAA
ncbi:MAG: ABC transporter substrate-binding protein [Xanthobacteraceae bacterium]|jgi:ABC-type nitrate/sulfonate/bicarbonate transport system substrate-binding protein